MASADLVHGRPTPFLLVDRAVLTANVAQMAEQAGRADLSLRPHAKTHKCLEIARLQVDAGAVGLTVATVSEAELFVSGGFTDLFIAYPLWVDEDRGTRLRALRERADVTVGVDSAEGARAVAAQVPGASVLVEVDSGQHRSGVPAASAGTLAQVAAHCGLDVRGIFTFPGHGYAPGLQETVAGEEASALATAAASLRELGVPAAVVSGGSTPTARHTDASVLSELRPGVYVFGDAQQWELDVASPSSLALSCVSTVVSVASGRVVLDAGSKVLGADRPGWTTGFGRLLDHPDARIASLSEHHAVVEWDDNTPAPEPGSRLRVVPNHVCAAVNLADELVLDDGEVWRVVARGANT